MLGAWSASEVVIVTVLKKACTPFVVPWFRCNSFEGSAILRFPFFRKAERASASDDCLGASVAEHMAEFTCNACGFTKAGSPYVMDGVDVCQECFARKNPILYRCDKCGGCQLMAGEEGVDTGVCHQGCASPTCWKPCKPHEEESFLDSLLHGLLTCGSLR